MKGNAPTWMLLAGIGAVLFVVDTSTDSGIAVSVLYVIPVLIALSTRLKNRVVHVGVASMALILASHAISPGLGTDDKATLANLALSIFAIASTTYLSRKIVRAESDGRTSRAQIARISRGISMKEMTVSIVHEVSQPLSAIAANAAAAKRWLERSPTDPGETRAALERITRDADRATAVVDRLRQFMSNAPPAMDRVDLVELLADSVALMRHEIDGHGIDVAIVSRSRSVVIGGDRILLQQIFLNLFSNAIDAMRGHSKTPLLTIEVACDAKSATVDVRDTGTGVRPEMLARLFDPFFTSKGEGRGMGIGLAVSRSIAEAHGGSMHAYLNKPQGLCLTLVLPAGRGNVTA